MQQLVTCAEMRAFDSAAMALGVSGAQLMENAAGAALQVIMRHTPATVQVFCGGGNNAGDGYALARRLFCVGIHVTAVAVCDPAALRGDAAQNYRAAQNYGVSIVPWHAFHAPPAPLIADALLGTGIHGEVTGDIAAAIAYINASGAHIVALDIPSGIAGDSGAVCGTAVHAAQTVTFGLPKIGLYSPLSAAYTGEIITDDISILPQTAGKRFLIERGDICLPTPSPAAHKGDGGRVLVIGGSPGMVGAVFMTASAAEKSGAGTVTAMVPEALLPIMMTRLTGAMCTDFADEAQIERASAVLIGNGMRQSAHTELLVRRALECATGTLVIDADGLNVLDTALLPHAKADVILTPHMGEMARLTGLSIAEITRNRVEIAEDFAARYGVTVVLKGAYTVVAAKDGTTYINTTGNAGMAKGGSGDILAGLTVGFAAAGVSNPSVAAVHVHGLAGDIAAETVGKRAMTAENILNSLSDAIKCM